MIELHTLTPIDGHRKIVIEDSDPAKRKELAEHVEKILKLGHAVFVETKEDTFRVTGYDPVTNEWVVKKQRGRSRKVSAQDSKATSVPPRAGG